jgi:hypothetical protein
MLKTLLITAAVGGLMVSDTLAQSTNSGASGPKFVAAQTSDQWVFSKFKGTNVVGPNDEGIGAVSDMLFDKTGKISGVIVGVGGFLGIGQKNVAMEMSAFQVLPATTSSSAAPVTGASPDPTDVKLKVAWTKEQLQQAPDFQYFKLPSGAASNNTGPTTGLAPRPAPAPRPTPMAPAPAPQ